MYFELEKGEASYTTTGCDCDLDSVTSWLAHLLQVQGFMGGFIVSSFDAQWSSIDTDLTRIKMQKAGCVTIECQGCKFSCIVFYR